MPLLLVCILIVAAAAMEAAFLLPFRSVDIALHMGPWLSKIVQRGFAGVAGEYSDYTPPYLYMLAIGSIFSGTVTDVAIIKLIPLAFHPLAAVLAGLIVWNMTKLRSRAILAGFLFLLLPTGLLNSAAWGQTDIIYTAALLGFLLATLRRNSIAACIWLGLAFSYKLQTVFVAPYLLFLLLERDVRWRHLPIVPIVYALLMIPAWVAGRPWLDLLLIYDRQANEYQALRMSAPNIYLVLDGLPGKELLFVLGLIVSGAIALILVYHARSLTRATAPAGANDIKLVAATASVLFIPYFLPRMHDRYFFTADVFTYILAFAKPQFTAVALATQAGSLAVYLGYLYGWAPGARVGTIFMTVAVMMMAFEFGRSGNPAPTIGNASRPIPDQ